jgi:hypothetical protein
VPLRVPIGTVTFWRSSLLHAVSPHLDTTSWRYHIFVAYVPRWVRGSFRGALSTDACPDPTDDAALMATSSPVRRQLLGAMGDLSAPREAHYWFPSSDEQVPLKAWAEEQLQKAGSGAAAQHNGGTTGHGVGFSRGLVDLAALPLGERRQAAKRVFAKDAPQLVHMAEGQGGYRNLMNGDVSWLANEGKPGAWRDIDLSAIRSKM